MLIQRGNDTLSTVSCVANGGELRYRDGNRISRVAR